MVEQILRKLPSFRGKQRLAKMLLKNKIATLIDVIVNDRNGCVFKIPNIKENIGFELFIYGEYEPEIIKHILGAIPENGVMLDIGANIGAIAIPVCKQRKDIVAICVEASPRVFSYLKFNIEKNSLENCKLKNYAVTENDNKTVDFFSPVELFGKGSLTSVFTQDSEKVVTISLDSLITQNCTKKVDLIKIDIEGHEYGAFKGGAAVLSMPDSPDILFEFVDWAEELANNCKPGDAQQLLMDYGYKLFQLNRKGILSELQAPLLKGAAMIFATKK